jgi:hypothetical protein
MTPYREPPARKSAVVRAPSQTYALLAMVVLLALACAALASAAALGWIADPFLAGLGALLCGCGAVGVLFGKVLAGSGSAPCPGCGAPIHDIDRQARVQGILCTRCNLFLKSKSGVLRPIPQDTVAADPIFGAALPLRFDWPPGCAVCGALETRSSPVRVVKSDGGEGLIASGVGVALLATTGMGFVMRTGKRIAIDVPHCVDHEDGAALTDGGPAELLLLFRSYPYQRAFCALNNTQAAESPETGREIEYPDEVLPPKREDVVAARGGTKSRRGNASRARQE